MWYYDFDYKGHKIEFKNNSWDGIEHILVDGMPVSSKFSVMGSNHTFELEGDRCDVLIRMNSLSFMTVQLSFYVNRRPIFEKAEIRPGSKDYDGSNVISFHRYRGRKLMQVYDIEEAIEEFKEALRDNPSDVKSHYLLACCFSLMENVEEGFKHLDFYITKKPKEIHKVMEEDHLAFLRMQPEFDKYVG